MYKRVNGGWGRRGGGVGGHGDYWNSGCWLSNDHGQLGDKTEPIAL